MTFSSKFPVAGPGRKPIRLDDAALELVADLASKGCHEVTIARHAGVSYPTWQKMRERDPRVRAAMERGKAREHDVLTGALHRMSEKNNVAAAIFLLKARHGYSDQGNTATPAVQVNVTLPGAVPLGQWRGRTVEGEARRDDDGDGDGEK